MHKAELTFIYGAGEMYFIYINSKGEPCCNLLTQEESGVILNIKSKYNE